jgi:hypothetical protein
VGKLHGLILWWHQRRIAYAAIWVFSRRMAACENLAHTLRTSHECCLLDRQRDYGCRLRARSSTGRKGTLGSISPFIVARTLLLNTPVALICGWLFWNFGFEAAILAHFSADIVYHVVGTVILQLMYQAKT